VSSATETDRVLATLTEARERREPCVLVTVVSFKGSTPRKPGAKMLVSAQGAIVGTIGGGAVELSLTEEAQTILDEATPRLVERHLTNELGMCCGGGMTVLMEPQVYAPRLFLFGAGHVAMPLAKVATLAGFEVHVIDNRENLATAERFPSVRQLLVEEPLDVIDSLGMEADQTYVVIVTHDHALDEAIVAEVMKRSYRYLGVIGSDRKREMFKKRLSARGLDDAAIQTMRTPMGLDIGAETPEEIAVSITAEMIQLRRERRS
jgi:xanthine dehydrogenase accessory factor